MSEPTPALSAYVVLKVVDDNIVDVTRFDQDRWIVVDASVSASGSDAAIRAACKSADSPAGTYVAVPARSWKPVVVKAETQTVLKLEAAG